MDRNCCELCGQEVRETNDARLLHLLLNNQVKTAEELKRLPEYEEFMKLKARHIMPTNTQFNSLMGVLCPGSPARQLLIKENPVWEAAYHKLEKLFR